ncbi:hypothetical protein GCM10010399_63220 [Dactylosporangium fulvum]|uniref:hypothetical protein n=1 Tax=Dactylosporangium fulvum TaxID=53359 RepID=UPI0031DA26FC
MTAEFVSHLQQHGAPVRVPRAGDVVWDDEALHAERYRADPQRYALTALVPGALAAQRCRVLLQLLVSSWAGHDDETRATLSRVCRVLALGLAPTDVLTVLLAVRRRRANHRHVTRTALAVLLEHPDAAELIRARRGIAVDCFEHALGKRTARACARQLAEGRPVRHALARFGAAPGRVPLLYTPVTTTAVTAPAAATGDLDMAGERPDVVTATNRGDLAATLVHLFRGGPGSELDVAAGRYLDAATAALPRYHGRVALVVDDSASMRGYGDREWAVASQVDAFRRVLERVCETLVVVRVGGAGDRPGGATDLATGVLDAVGAGADVVAVASDGYENVYPGDLARVAETLPRVGVHTPVVFCQATFGHADDLTLRRPAPRLPQRSFWHSDDLAALVLWVLSHVEGAEAERWLGAELRRRLILAERVLEGGSR